MRALDLVGWRFGALVVVAPSGPIGVRGRVLGWHCRCDCGVELIVPQARMPVGTKPVRPDKLILACRACRGGPCVVCGAPRPPARLRHRTCSARCAKRHRAVLQASYMTRPGAKTRRQARLKRQRSALVTRARQTRAARLARMSVTDREAARIARATYLARWRAARLADAAARDQERARLREHRRLSRMAQLARVGRALSRIHGDTDG